MFTHSEIVAKLGHLDDLWNALYVNSQKGTYKHVLFQWLSDMCRNAPSAIDDPLSKFFESTLCKFADPSVDKDFAFCFQQFMEYSNIRKGKHSTLLCLLIMPLGNLYRAVNQSVSVKSIELIGLQELWKLVLEGNPQTASVVRNFLVNLYKQRNSMMSAKMVNISHNIDRF